MSKTLDEMLNEMGGIGEPFGLFEPYLWKDKLGDSNWKCEINSVDAHIWSGEGDTPLEAVRAAYESAKKFNRPHRQ